jgi:hypothetical protein
MNWPVAAQPERRMVAPPTSRRRLKTTGSVASFRATYIAMKVRGCVTVDHRVGAID